VWLCVFRCCADEVAPLGTYALAQCSVSQYGTSSQRFTRRAAGAPLRIVYVVTRHYTTCSTLSVVPCHLPVVPCHLPVVPCHLPVVPCHLCVGASAARNAARWPECLSDRMFPTFAATTWQEQARSEYIPGLGPLPNQRLLGTHARMHSLTHPLTHSDALTHSLTHAHTHSLTHHQLACALARSFARTCCPIGACALGRRALADAARPRGVARHARGPVRFHQRSCPWRTCHGVV
jgi:hypothetical protein